MDKLDVIKSKIVSLKELLPLLTSCELKNHKVVFTNGCFDIIHRGHIEYLAKSASYGDVLIIGLNTDQSIEKIKATGRPMQDEKSRALILAALHFVGYVVLFDEETPYELIREIKPDVLVKGKDYKVKDIVGYDIVKENGGEVKTIDFLKGYSTSAIIERIKKEV